MSDGPSQWERAIFEFDPTAPRPRDRFLWNLKYITTSRTRPRMQNFRGLHRRAWSAQIASLTHESLCPFLVSSPRPQVAPFDAPHAQYVIMVKVVPFGGYNDEIWNLTLFTSKNVKIGTLSWRSMENCSHPNCGTISHIQFKLGAGIQYQSGITWNDSKVKRSKVKVTTSRHVSS